MKTAMNDLVSSKKDPAVGDEGTIHQPPSDADGASCDDASSATSSSPEEFVNTGLQRWEGIRSQWLESCRSSASTSSSSTSAVPSQPGLKPKRHAKDIDIDDVIDLIVSNRWRQQAPPKHASSSTSSLDTAKSATRRRDDACFPSPVSLPQMVDVLVDLWEAEGLDI
ncbi:predicted protein [Thalassiosira pseudonana CCMP1335]|uniref:Gag1-like clamp domain-containing protein n=1 Tax=Thalassiosira pseudonana TaxID=35128 RepID=B8C294_THAPS|nr:predicted protein [Thalassiosira pseudonana CCMP1335]EED92346.1 predicted protein [Thalassiosira pseudonana CCMP1335]